MSIGMQIFDDLLDSREIIDSQIAHVTAYWREVQESNGNSSACEFVNQSQADLGGHHRNTADVVLHHSLGGLSSSAGVIIRVAENGVVTKLLGADFETLDHFRKERILNVRHNDSECAAVARSEVPRMHVGKISETLDGREYQQVRAPPYLARLVQDIGHGRSGYPCSLRHITNR